MGLVIPVLLNLIECLGNFTKIIGNQYVRCKVVYKVLITTSTKTCHSEPKKNPIRDLSIS